MSGIASQEIQSDFINELKGYIPALTEMTGKLASRVGGKTELTELYRLVHTVKGASSLVKLKPLSTVAAELEGVLEDVMARRLDLSPEVLDAIRSTLDYFDAYTLNATAPDADHAERMTGVLAFLKSIRSRAVESAHPDVADDLFAGIDSQPALPSGFGDQVLSDPAVPAQTDLGILDDDDLCVDEHLCVDDGDMLSPPAEAAADDWGDDDIELPQEELREGFYQEAEEHFQTLGKALDALESQITAVVALDAGHKELLRLIRRAVHTIKGAAAVIKLKDIAEWGHAFEDLLDWLYEAADRIDPQTIRIMLAAADILQQYVAAPDRVDHQRADEIRVRFRQMIDSHTEEEIKNDSDQPDGDGSIYLFDPPVASGDVNASNRAPVRAAEKDTVEADAVTTFRAAQTLRVQMAKVEALVNLTGELIVALSAFDDNMSGMGDVIGELERSRHRLQHAVRDLEVGYEVKAIQHLATQAAEMPALAATADGEPGAFDDFDILELDRYSAFHLLIRSLNETAVDVNTISAQLSDMHSGFSAYLNRLRTLTSDLQNKVMRIRMTPMSTIMFRLRQTVRETAGTLGKNVRMAVSGQEIELDKRVWDALADPLMHLLRNAIDHGIESPSRREAVGKPDLATIQLSAAYQGNQVIIRVTDDGAGLDYAAIRKRAEALSLEKPLCGMDDDALAELIFRQGFSTREQVTNISGRGVGLDVVRENIVAMKGSVHIEPSAPGSGATFVIRMPLTLAVLRALLFEVGGRLYATALYDIKEVLRIHPRDIHTRDSENGKVGTVKIGDRQMPFYYLAEALCPETSSQTIADTAQRCLVLVLDTGTWQGAVAIDRMRGQREIVIKNLGAHLEQVRGISGATIMGNGSVVPIVNLEELLKTTPVVQRPGRARRPAVAQRALRIMVVDDSVSVRTVVSRLMQRQGWQVQSANDGVDAIEKLRNYRPDLILLDVEMPRMNGYEFMSAIRSQKTFEAIPVVMLTSRSAGKHRDRARASGVNGYVVKPYEDEMLIDLIRRLTSTTADGGQIS